uniref:Uncharacterized protein n=1 Tax=Ascaris lumbricoides TaxID=6252 RepID=A0A9J2PQR1_ASCLU
MAGNFLAAKHSTYAVAVAVAKVVEVAAVAEATVAVIAASKTVDVVVKVVEAIAEVVEVVKVVAEVAQSVTEVVVEIVESVVEVAAAVAAAAVVVAEVAVEVGGPLGLSKVDSSGSCSDQVLIPDASEVRNVEREPGRQRTGNGRRRRAKTSLFHGLAFRCRASKFVFLRMACCLIFLYAAAT